MNIGTLWATLGVNTVGLQSATVAMRRFETTATASITRVNAQLATAEASMKKFAATAQRNLTMPLVLLGGASFVTFKNFEASLSKVIGLVGVAEDQVNEWRQTILDIGPAVGQGPVKLADALFFITSAGIRGAEAMEVLEMSSKAASAGLGEAKVVADLVTSAMNAYGAANLSAAHATDILTATVREGKAEPAELSASMGMVLPIASEMEVTFNQIGAAIAGMTRTGSNASTASMQLRQILASILKPTSLAEEALKKMNTTSEDLLNTIKTKGLLAGLMEVRNLMNKYGADVASKVFPNVRALSGVLDLMGKNLEDNRKIFEALDGATGSLDKAFRAASETVQFRFNAELARGQVSLVKLGESVAEGFLPVLEKMIGVFTSLVDWFAQLDGVSKRIIVTIGGVLIVLGPMAKLLGFLVGNILPNLLLLGTRLITMFRMLATVMLSNPITVLLAGIGALAAIILTYTNRTEDAALAQRILNDELERTKKLTKATQEIENFMGVLDELNQRQLTDLKNRIENQIKAEEDFTTNQAAEAKKQVQQYEQAMKTMEEVHSNFQKRQEKITELRLTQEHSMLSGSTRSMQVTIEDNEDWIQKIEEESQQTRLEKLTQFLKQVKIQMEELKKSTDVQSKFTLNVEQQEVITEMDRRLDILNRTSEAYGGTLDLTADKLNIYEEAIRGLIERGINPQNTTLQELIKLQEELNSELENSIDPLKEIKMLEDVLGRSYDGTNVRLQLLNAQLKEGILLGTLTADSIDRMKEAITKLQNTQTVTSIIDELNSSLTAIAAKSFILGENFDASANMISTYENALISLLINGIGPGNVLFDRYIEKLKALREQQSQVGVSSQEMSMIVQNSITSMAETLGTSIGELFTGLGEAGGFFSGLIDVIANFMQALGVALIASAKAAEAFKKLFIEPLAGIIAGLALIALSGVVRAIFQKGPAGMADGGIVPQGFPNDSFPAMLQSGEAVIPLDRLPSILGRISSEPSGRNRRESYFVVKGRDLEAVLEQQNKFKNSF